MESKSRLFLTLAMAALVLNIAIAAAAALTTLSRIHKEESALRASAVANSRRLEQVRAAIYSSASEPRTPPALETLRDDTLRQLTTPDTASLRGEVVAWFRLLELMNEMAERPQSPGVDAWFRRQIAQRRSTMLELSTAIAAALGHEWETNQQQIDSLYSSFRAGLALGLGLVMALAVAVSIVTVRRTVKLEAEARSLSVQLLQAQEEERRAIARELHDEVGQSLSGALLEEASPALRQRLQAAVDSVRRIALSLRPSMLDDLGLVAALEWQAREIGNRTGLAIEIQAEESAGTLPEAHRTCIFRVAQEALRNCARHSEATRVKIALDKAVRSVTLAVEDNGKGFRVGRTRGLGLLGMEERVTQLGGSFRLRSEPGRGATVLAELPL
jgi:signal transduction histidine kinase